MLSTNALGKLLDVYSNSAMTSALIRELFVKCCCFLRCAERDTTLGRMRRERMKQSPIACRGQRERDKKGVFIRLLRGRIRVRGCIKRLSRSAASEKSNNALHQSAALLWSVKLAERARRSEKHRCRLLPKAFRPDFPRHRVHKRSSVE